MKFDNDADNPIEASSAKMLFALHHHLSRHSDTHAPMRMELLSGQTISIDWKLPSLWYAFGKDWECVPYSFGANHYKLGEFSGDVDAFIRDMVELKMIMP